MESFREMARQLLPKAKAAKRLSPHARGYDARWRRIRLMTLRAEPLCRSCKADGIITAATEVDHIIPLRHGGTHDADNLQPLCKSCHSRKTYREQAR